MKRSANSRAFRRVEDAAAHIFIQIYAGNTRRFARWHPGDRRGDGRCDTAGSAIFPARKFFHTQVRFLQADVFADKEQGKSPQQPVHSALDGAVEQRPCDEADTQTVADAVDRKSVV